MILIFILVIVLCSSFVLSIYLWTSPVKKSVSVPILNYSHKAVLDYQVNLVPNPFFQAQPSSKDTYYFANIINTISLGFTYNVTTSLPAKVKAVASVTGVVTAYDSLAEEASPIWQKEYSMVPAETFTGENGHLTFEKKLDVNLESFRSDVNAFFTLVGVEPARVILTIRGEVQSDSESYGVLGGPLSVSLDIPLNAKYFKVTGEPVAEKDGDVTETKEIIDSKVSLGRIVFPASVLVSLIILVSVMLNTSSEEVDALAKEFSNIRKKYAGRIVNSPGVQPNFTREINVSTFQDLVKVADELGKPIISCASQDLTQVFYVIDGEVSYRYSMGRLLRQERGRA